MESRFSPILPSSLDLNGFCLCLRANGLIFTRGDSVVVVRFVVVDVLRVVVVNDLFLMNFVDEDVDGDLVVVSKLYDGLVESLLP